MLLAYFSEADFMFFILSNFLLLFYFYFSQYYTKNISNLRKSKIKYFIKNYNYINYFKKYN